MPVGFSGRPIREEQDQAVRLVAWSLFEKIVFAVIIALAIVGVAVPWLQGQWFPALIVLPLFGLFILLLVRRQAQRRQLVREVVANNIDGIWADDALEFSDPNIRSVGLLPKNLRDCQLGPTALVVWSDDLPAVAAASLFVDPIDWEALRNHVDQARRGPLRTRAALLTASVIAWIAILALAWSTWEAWTR